MAGSIPDSISGWLKEVGRSEPRELTSLEKRELWEMLRSGVFREAVRRVALDLEGKRESMERFNLLDTAQASEASQIQGELRGAVAIFEQLWETVRDE